MSAYSPCINYSDSKFFKRSLKWFQDRACLCSAWKSRYAFKRRQKSLKSSPRCRERHGFVCTEMKGKQRGFRSRLSTPPGVNQAIPPKLMSPKRLIGSGVFRALVIGSRKHRGLYLIGSGTALGRGKDWGLSRAPKSNLVSDGTFMCLSRTSSCVASFVPFKGNRCNDMQWCWFYWDMLSSGHCSE